MAVSVEADGPTIMTPSKPSSCQAPPAVATLDEIARRLVAIHYPLAEHLDGDAELQRQTRKRVEELMALFVDDAIDAHD
jgi:hypothetical protein